MGRGTRSILRAFRGAAGTVACSFRTAAGFALPTRSEGFLHAGYVDWYDLHALIWGHLPATHDDPLLHSDRR